MKTANKKLHIVFFALLTLSVITFVSVMFFVIFQVNHSKHFDIDYKTLYSQADVSKPIFYFKKIETKNNQKVIESRTFAKDGARDYFILTAEALPETKPSESLSVYATKNGKPEKLIRKNVKKGDKCCLGFFEYDGFALVKEMPSVKVKLQSVSVKPEKDVEIKLEGYMPEGVSAKAVPVKEKGICSYDISVYDGKKAVFQPTIGKPLKVTIKSAALKKAKGKALDAVHITKDGKTEFADIISVKNNSVTFAAEHFSQYIIRRHEDDSGNPVTPRRTYHFLSREFEKQTQGSDEICLSNDFEFYNTAGDIQSTQIIKNNDALELIPIPEHIDGLYFYGWYVVEYISSSNGVTYYKWGENPERVEFNKAITVSETSDTDIYVAPVYSNYRFVTFHENEADQPNGENVLTRKLVALGDTHQLNVKISDVRAQPPDAQRIVFWGWSYNGTIKQTVDADGTEIEQFVTVTSNDTDCNLYPVFKQARWLTFDTGGSGTGAKYVPSRFVVQGDSVSSLPTTTRTGYIFNGWYTAETGGTQVTYADGEIVSGTHDLGQGNRISGGELTLEENMKLYARWTEISTANYVVIFWKQKVTDPKNATENNKTYDYDSSVTRNGNSGTDAEATNADKTKNYTGFYFSKTTVNNNGKIKSDGTTVINVYYDRQVMAINFYYRTTDTYPSGYTTPYTYTATTSTTGTQYGIIGGEYVQLTRSTEQHTEYYLSRTSNGSEYTGTIYDENSQVVTNPVYPNTYYRSTNRRNQLYWRTRTVTNYIWSYNNEVYLGTRYTRSTNSSYGAMLTWTGLYGSTFEQNGYDWATVSGQRWNENSNGGGTTQTMLDGFTQDSTPYNLYSQGQNGNNYIYHYKQNIDGSYSLDKRVAARTTNTSGTFNFSNKFEGFTVSTYSTNTEGFSAGGGTHPATAGTSTSATYPLHVYHERNKYSLTLNYNYTGSPQPYVISNIPYEARISDYLNTNASYYKPSREHYNFLGWYQADHGDPNDPPDFDANASMPSANKVAYGHWDAIWYLIQIDPNGAEIDHINGTDRGSTYFWLSYGSTIGQYQDLVRNYVPDDNGNYVYMNITFNGENNGYGVNANLRNALYIPYQSNGDYHGVYRQDFGGYTYESSGMSYQDFLSCISTQRYSAIAGNESYTLLGWYRVRSNGTLSPTPYNFSDEVEEDVTLKAVWKRSEFYYLAYNPVMTGQGVGGTISQTLDPDASQSGGKYTDQATAVILTGPSNITPGYKFQGWRIVDGSGRPLQNGIVYDPGEDFTVDAQYADSDGCIHMEAFYEPENAMTMRRVSVASLVMDANGGEVNSSGITLGSTYIYTDTTANTLHLEKQHNNKDVLLMDYYDNFESDIGHVLLGWNKTASSGNYIPEYYADAQIGIDKNGTNTIYAVWEPTVYISFVNECADEIEINLSFTGYGGTIYTGHINEVTSRFEREEFNSNRLVIQPGDTVKFVLPEGDGATYTFNGTYRGSRDRLYVYNSGLGTTTALRNNPFSGTGTLITSREGRVITFSDTDIIVPAPSGVNDNKNGYVYFLAASVILAGAAAIILYRKRRKDITEI